MADVFEGKPDGRQSSDVAHKVSRFRPTYRALSDSEKKLHDDIKAKAVELEDLLGSMTRGDGTRARYHALAMTSLEEAVMWGVKALTS